MQTIENVLTRLLRKKRSEDSPQSFSSFVQQVNNMSILKVFLHFYLYIYANQIVLNLLFFYLICLLFFILDFIVRSF